MNLVGYGGRCSKAQDCPTPPGADRGVCRSHYCQTGKQGASCGHSGDCVPPKGRNHGVCRDGKCQDPCRNQPPRGSDPRHGPRTIRVVVMASPRPVHAISPRGRSSSQPALRRRGPARARLTQDSPQARTEDCQVLLSAAGRRIVPRSRCSRGAIIMTRLLISAAPIMPSAGVENVRTAAPARRAASIRTA